MRATPPPFNAMRIPVRLRTTLTFVIAGLTVGDPVYRTGNPLSVELGPGKHDERFARTSGHKPCALIFLFINYCLGILNTIFDGIQRPLKTIATMSGSVFIPRGVEVPCLDQHHEWEYKPNPGLKVGDKVSGGDVIGFVFENDIFYEHRIMVPPKVRGVVKEI